MRQNFKFRARMRMHRFFVEILANRQFRLISPVECDFENGISENRIFLGYEIETMV